jgi:DNA-binding response OmpR family regulator
MSETTQQKPLVLFVDDMPDLPQLVAVGARLYDPPFDVAFADCRESALKVIRERSPAAVVLDVNLSGETGIAIAEDLSRHYPQIRKAVLTAYDRSVTRANAEEFGMEVWAKPITIEDLITRVKDLLASGPTADAATTFSHLPNVARVVLAALGLFGGVPVHKVH